ncbi:hypothetical protein IJ556_03875 [bacterium]|nr:hypothetical protein [bacterium]MBR2274182.1 hypothetical protein [Alphaproteobacteria bacterium]
MFSSKEIFMKKEQARERRRVKDILRSIWNFWTSPEGAFILAVSAMALGYYQFYISRPILRYDTNTIKLISSSNSNNYTVDVMGKKYEDLYLTKVYLYNQGEQALSGSDVSRIGHDPIRIQVPSEAQMQHYNLDSDETTSSITAEIVPYGKDLVLNFDFLNPDYQYVVNILHEHPTNDFIVTGSALNVSQITRAISGRELKDCLIWGLGSLYLLLIIYYVIRKWRRH